MRFFDDVHRIAEALEALAASSVQAKPDKLLPPPFEFTPYDETRHRQWEDLQDQLTEVSQDDDL